MARLEEEAARHPGSARRPRRPRWTNPYLLTAAAAAVVVIVLATTHGLHRRRRPAARRREPVLITASEVRARVAGALASLETLRGEITFDCEINYGTCPPPEAGGRTTLRWSFVTTAAGDERVTGIGVTDDIAFSATTRHRNRSWSTSASGPQGVETTNVGAGPPDCRSAGRPCGGSWARWSGRS